MATSFDDIYTMFLNQIRTDDFQDMDIEDFKEIAEGYLINSLVTVQEAMSDVMDVDLVSKQFNQDLHLAEKIILSKAMKLEWLRKKKYAEDFMMQTVGDRDYKVESGSVYLKALGEEEAKLAKEIRHDLVRFSYSREDFTGRFLS